MSVFLLTLVKQSFNKGAWSGQRVRGVRWSPRPKSGCCPCAWGRRELSHLVSVSHASCSVTFLHHFYYKDLQEYCIFISESDEHSKCGLSDISYFEYVIHMSPHVGKLSWKQTVGVIPPISAPGAVLSGDTPPALGTWGLLTTHSPHGGGTHCWTAWRRVSGCDKPDTERSRTACQRLCSKCVEMISEAEEARAAWWKNGYCEKEHTGSRKRELAYYMRRWGDRGMEERAEEITQNAG